MQDYDKYYETKTTITTVNRGSTKIVALENKTVIETSGFSGLIGCTDTTKSNLNMQKDFVKIC